MPFDLVMDMLQAGCIIGLMKKSHKTNCWYVDKYLFVTDVLTFGFGDWSSKSFGRYIVRLGSNRTI